jgi:3-hydroxybutyrate dehydrogenase
MLMELSRPAPLAAKQLAGRVAIVTGSTSGIGLGIARSLAEAGAAVVLNGLGNIDDVGEIVAGISAEYGVRAIYSPVDMTKPGSIARMVDLTLETFGRLDILVNNAGVQHVAPIDQFPPEKWDQVIAIDLSSAFHTTRLAVPAMRKTGWGRIVNVASAHGLVASPFKAAYVAAKHGIVGLTKVTAPACDMNGRQADARTASAVTSAQVKIRTLQVRTFVADRNSLMAEPRLSRSKSTTASSGCRSGLWFSGLSW